MAPSVKQRKIAILGSRSVGLYPADDPCKISGADVHAAGKSSLTVRYCEGHFVEAYYPTIENTFSHEIQYKGQNFLTEIIDTQGQVIAEDMSVGSRD